MPRYLVVAHQTADSPTLLAKLHEMAAADPEAEFQVLAPVRSRSLSQELAGERRSPWEIAWWRAERTRQRLRAAGLKVIGARPGVRDPWLDPADRIDHELRYGGPYSAVVISTLPRPFSEWLRRDVPHRVARRHPEVRVLHVTAPDPFHLELDSAERGRTAPPSV